MRRSYLDYSMSVIIGRALPDARDGLKPVHRRMLYTMERDGPAAQQEIRQVRQGGGPVPGKYHPHGDSSIYDALVRMAQPFSCAIRWLTGRATSVRWMAIRRRRYVTPSAAWSALPKR
jgi:DNA gyrase subunit A